MSVRQFDAILFDLGNTLMYFDADWIQVLPRADLALLHSLRKAGLDLDDRFTTVFRGKMEYYYQEREKDYIENTTFTVLSSVLAEFGYQHIPEAVLRQALSALHAVTQAHWQPEADTLPVLQALQTKGYRLGMISNAGDDADVQILVDKTGVRPYFDIILTSAAEGIRKPNPRIFLKALEFLGAHPSHAAMVGDLLGTDILGARNAGIFSIWITRRVNIRANQARHDAIKPDAEIFALSELPPLLDELHSQ
jgi:HAD superfamily hydrolase (TIGR01549 family)